MQRGRRKLKNLLIFPESQVRYGLVFLSLATFAHVTLTIAVLKIYSAWGTSEGELSSAPVWLLIAGLFLLYFLLQAFAFVLGLLMSHKLFGPLVAISKFAEDLKNGNYGERLRLRKTDDPALHGLADELNSLAEKLQTK